mgnify:CR=1 FL=1
MCHQLWDKTYLFTVLHKMLVWTIFGKMTHDPLKHSWKSGKLYAGTRRWCDTRLWFILTPGLCRLETLVGNSVILRSHFWHQLQEWDSRNQLLWLVCIVGAASLWHAAALERINWFENGRLIWVLSTIGSIFIMIISYSGSSSLYWKWRQNRNTWFFESFLKVRNNEYGRPIPPCLGLSNEPLDTAINVRHVEVYNIYDPCLRLINLTSFLDLSKLVCKGTA